MAPFLRACAFFSFPPTRRSPGLEIRTSLPLPRPQTTTSGTIGTILCLPPQTLFFSSSHCFLPLLFFLRCFRAPHQWIVHSILRFFGAIFPALSSSKRSGRETFLPREPPIRTRHFNTTFPLNPKRCNLSVGSSKDKPESTAVFHTDRRTFPPRKAFFIDVR